MAILKNMVQKVAEQVLKDDIQTMNENMTQLSEAVSLLQAEERGWTNVSQGYQPGETTAEERLRILTKTRKVYKKNPLAGQIVDLKRYFTTGQGISFKAENPEVQEIIKAFWDDESNKWFQRQSQLSDDIEIDGEFYLRFFDNKHTGRVQVRSIPAPQITDIITDPEDAETPIFYKREWVEQKWNESSKLYEVVKHHTGAYADFIPADEILYVKVGAPLHSKFGNAPLYRILGYLTAYKEWLEDRVKINRARGAFAWKKKIKNAGSAVMGAASAVRTAINKVIKGTDAPTPPTVGSVIVENDTVEWSVVNSDIKADNAAEDGRAIKLMICAGSGIFEHYFGDAKTANLASATAMELPMLKMFEWRQKLFEESIFKPIFRRVIRAAIEAGTLPEITKVTRQEKGKEIELELPTDQINIHIDFPPLVLKEIDKLTTAVVKQVESGLKSKQTAGMELGVEDWDQEKTRMASEAEEAAAKARQNDTNLFPEFNPPGEKQSKKKSQSNEPSNDNPEEGEE